MHASNTHPAGNMAGGGTASFDRDSTAIACSTALKPDSSTTCSLGLSYKSTRLRERCADEHHIRAKRTRAEPVPGRAARVRRQQHYACRRSSQVTLYQSVMSRGCPRRQRPLAYNKGTWRPCAPRRVHITNPRHLYQCTGAVCKQGPRPSTAAPAGFHRSYCLPWTGHCREHYRPWAWPARPMLPLPAPCSTAGLLRQSTLSGAPDELAWSNTTPRPSRPPFPAPCSTTSSGFLAAGR